MEEEVEEVSDVYMPQQTETESIMEDETVANPTQCEEAAAAVEIDDSQLVGSPIDTAAAVGVDEEAAPSAEIEGAEAATEATEMEVVESSRGRGGKRKRGRPARVQSKPPARNSKKEEEEVCFICFDGGNLVLCDRRFCPKAYHPACVNRDEAFFQSRGRWNCGWHICSNCEKAAYYMCYTCTYSLCKGCIKEAEFLCVRGNKGFCETCMRTVMMIEKAEHGNKEMAQVDFDDKNSWEYLFKDYWLDLKGKLSLTLDELTGARNPWKGSGVLALNEGSSDELYDANDDPGSGSDSSSGHHEGSNSKRKKAKRRPKSVAIEEESLSAVKLVGGEGASVPDDTDWASKELLEFVEHMKDGDKSVLSQFDVQALLLEYIKRNNLRDPRRKSQIICDSRLQNLFGKARVGHFEMLKLLESHFLIKEASSQVFTDDIQRGATDTDAIQIDAEGNVDTVVRIGSDKKRKTRKKIEERVPQLNLDDYAAIDVHNINLIYLRRNLMEDLLQDIDKFQDKIVGSFVRIRISGTGQKQDMYRLVQVVGTAKAAEAYKTGKTTTDTMLEILNLNKTEIISIDTISNQEFSEEECKRLRQSIKCGFINRLTVGEVQEKARALQAVRVNDWLETEIMRLSHLRDRASEKGRRKELRECVEKLQLLGTPEERSRRLHELPEVHADPNMDPSYESDEDEGELDEHKRDSHMRPRDAGFNRKGRDPISPGKGSSGLNSGRDGTRKNSSTSWEVGANMPTKGSGWDKGDASISPGTHQPISWETTPKNQATTTGLDNGAWSSQPVSTGAAMSSKITENEKIWHYQDPSGKIQGPFSMIQLRKWSTTGYFPTDLRIWKTSEKQEDSILLADALIGKFHNEQSPWKPQQNSLSQPQLGTSMSDNRENNWDSTRTDRKQNDGNWNSSWKDASRPANENGTQSSAWAAPAAEVVNLKEGWVGSASQGQDSSKGASTTWSGQSQGHGHETNWNQHRAPSHQGRDGRGGGNSGRWNSGQNRENDWSKNRPTGFQSSGHGYERRSNNLGSSGQSSGWGANQGGRNEFLNLPTPTTPTPQPSSGGWSGGPTTTPTPRPSSGGWSGGLPTTPTPQPSSGSWSGGQGTEEWSPTSTVSVQPSSGWGTTPDSGGNEKQQSFAMGTQSVRTAGWGDQPPSSPTPSAGGLNSNLPSASMLKPTEAAVGWDASQVSSKLLTEGLGADQGGASDLSNLPSPTPKPKSGGWTVTQGAENKWAAASSVSVPPTSSGSGTAPTPGGNGAQVSSAVVNEPIKIVTDWNNQPPALVLPSVGGRDSSSVSSSIPKATEMADGRNAAQILPHNQLTHSSASLPAPLEPIAQEDGWGSHASEAPKSTLSSLPYQSVPELSNKEDRVAGNMETLLCAVGPTTPEPKNGCHTTQISDIVDSTPKAGALTSDGLSSQSSRNIPSQLTVAGGEPLVLHNNAVESAVAVDAWGSNPSHGPEVNWRASADISATGPAQKGLVPDVQGLAGNVPKPPVESHGWGPAATAQKPEVTGSNPRPGFESHGWGEPASALKQELANLTPKPELVVGGWGPSPPATNNMASQTGHSMVPQNPNRNNWPMPPTAQIPQPSGWDVGNSQNSTLAPPSILTPTPGNNPWPTGPAPEAPPAKTRWGPENPNVGNSQNSTLAPPSNQTPIPCNNPWPTGPAPEAPPAKTRWGPENPKMGWGMTPENPSAGWGTAGPGNTNTGWGPPAQGISNNGSGTAPQGNANMGWDASGGNPSARGTPQKHSEERFSGHGGRGFQGSDSGGHGGGRPSWNRTSSFGSGGVGGSGGSSRPPSRGPRVCKYHENGHCRKGASCGYLHT